MTVDASQQQVFDRHSIGASGCAWSLKSFWRFYKEFKLSLCLEMKEHGDLSAGHCIDK